jgi:hypothetical protein
VETSIATRPQAGRRADGSVRGQTTLGARRLWGGCTPLCRRLPRPLRRWRLRVDITHIMRSSSNWFGRRPPMKIQLYSIEHAPSRLPNWQMILADLDNPQRAVWPASWACRSARSTATRPRTMHLGSRCWRCSGLPAGDAPPSTPKPPTTPSGRIDSSFWRRLLNIACRTLDDICDLARMRDEQEMTSPQHRNL